MSTKFGNLKKLNLREIWPNEARDFTPWLADKIMILGEALGMELELKQREAEVGEFSLDLLAIDPASNRKVVIENQITQTDHDHLGKLLTYASGYDASVVIWVAESLRDEHKQTLDWLNRKTDMDTEFFGVTVEVVQIDQSAQAFIFKPVVFPSDWQKSRARSNSGPISEKMKAYQSFFQELIDELREKHKFTNAKRGQFQSWYSYASGYSGIVYSSNFALGGRVRVEIYIDVGDKVENKKIFDRLMDLKEKIEKNFGSELSWEKMEEKKASRIAVYRSGTIEADEKSLREIKIWMIEKLLKIKETFGPHLRPIINDH